MWIWLLELLDQQKLFEIFVPYVNETDLAKIALSCHFSHDLAKIPLSCHFSLDVLCNTEGDPAHA